MLINLGPHWIFISDFAYLFILILSSTDMQNRDKGLPNIISAGLGILVKILITLEPHGML